ncbi:unnamed protein product, partial [Discosporangium mesarthrocarpum]
TTSSSTINIPGYFMVMTMMNLFRGSSSDQPVIHKIDKVVAPPLAPHRETRYFQVVHRGGVSVRKDPTQPASEDAPSFNFGDVLEVEGLGLAVPEGVLLKVKSQQSGWVFERHGTMEILTEVAPPKVEEGQWWYRVVHPRGVRLAKIPSLDTQAPRNSATIPQNTVLRACRRHTPAGSNVCYVEVSNHKGWIFQGAADDKILECGSDGKPLMEHITGEFRDQSEGWYVVDIEQELLAEPNRSGPGLLEMFMVGKVFHSTERYQPPGEMVEYLKLAGRPGWVLYKEGELSYCKELPHPIDEEITNKWYRVEYPGGVRIRPKPSMEGTSSVGGVLVCGWVFQATRRFREIGSSQIFLEVAEDQPHYQIDQGVGKPLAGTGTGIGMVKPAEGRENGVATSNGGNESILTSASTSGREGSLSSGTGTPKVLGWVPMSKETIQVVKEVQEPRREKGMFPYQVVVEASIQATVGPHTQAPEVDHVLPPYCVVPVVSVLETGEGSDQECFVQLAETLSWVRASHGEDIKLERISAFPTVDRNPRKYTISAQEGVKTVVGPCTLAPLTGNVLAAGTEGVCPMLWSVGAEIGTRYQGGKEINGTVEGETGDRATVFALLDDVGWVCVSDSDEGDRGGVTLEHLPPQEEEEEE